DPQVAAPYLALADLYLQAGEFDLAAETGEKVRKLHPNDGTVYRLLGWAYLGQGDLNKAIATLQTAIAKSPRDANAYHALGLAYKQQQQEREAIAAFEQALELDPSSQQHAALDELVALYTAKGDTAKIEATYRQLLTQQPHNLRLQLLLAEL